MRKEMDLILSEDRPEKTFAAKWLNRAYRICFIWNVIMGITLFLQFLLFIISKSADYIIPGQGYIYGGAGIINAALVGGDVIVDKLSEKMYQKVDNNGTSDK